MYVDRSDDCYWIGKESLRSWRRLAMEKFEEMNKASQVPVKTETNGSCSSGLTNGPSSQDKSEDKKEKDPGKPTKKYLEFNEDALCITHGKYE